jgi:hypothetical protein
VSFTARTFNPGRMPQRSPRCERLITRLAAELEAETDDLTAYLVRGIVDEMELRNIDDDLLEELWRASRACVHLLSTMSRIWSAPRDIPAPPETLEWVRDLAARGFPLELPVRVFRIGHAGYLGEWERRLGVSGESTAVILESIGVISAYTFAWVDTVLAPVVNTNGAEIERNARSMHAVRLETLEEILSNELDDTQIAGARLGYNLTRPLLGFMVWSDTDGPDPALERLEEIAANVADLFDAGHRPLLLRAAPRLVYGWSAHGRCDTETAARAEQMLRGTTLRLAVGRAASGVAGFRVSHDDARRARRVARMVRRDEQVIRYEDVSTIDLLIDDRAAAERVTRSALGELARDDPKMRELRVALQTFLAEGHNYARAARRLGLHENTLAYRVRRALELAGTDDAGSLTLRAAIELASLLTPP